MNEQFRTLIDAIVSDRTADVDLGTFPLESLESHVFVDLTIMSIASVTHTDASSAVVLRIRRMKSPNNVAYMTILVSKATFDHFKLDAMPIPDDDIISTFVLRTLRKHVLTDATADDTDDTRCRISVATVCMVGDMRTSANIPAITINYIEDISKLSVLRRQDLVTIVMAEESVMLRYPGVDRFVDTDVPFKDIIITPYGEDVMFGDGQFNALIEALNPDILVIESSTVVLETLARAETQDGVLKKGKGIATLDAVLSHDDRNNIDDACTNIIAKCERAMNAEEMASSMSMIHSVVAATVFTRSVIERRMWE